MIINCPNARDKAPLEFVRNLISLCFRRIHQIPLPLSTHFHFFSAPLTVTHPSRHLFSQLGVKLTFFFRTPLPVTANNQSVKFHFIFSTEAASSWSSSPSVSSKNKKSTGCVTQKNTHSLLRRKMRADGGGECLFLVFLVIGERADTQQECVVD